MIAEISNIASTVSHPPVTLTCPVSSSSHPPPTPPPDSLLVPGPDDDVPAAAHLPQDGRPARPHHLPAAPTLRGLRPGGRQGAHRGQRTRRDHPRAPAVAQVAGQAAGARLAAVLQQHHGELSPELYLRVSSRLILTPFCAFARPQRATGTSFSKRPPPGVFFSLLRSDSVLFFFVNVQTRLTWRVSHLAVGFCDVECL